MMIHRTYKLLEDLGTRYVGTSSVSDVDILGCQT
jgi:hypothetical protein